MLTLQKLIEGGFEIKSTSAFFANNFEHVFVFVQRAGDVFVCKFRVDPSNGNLLQYASQQIA